MLCGLLLLVTPAILTADIGPAQAKQILEQLSVQVGENLICSPTLEDEILMVHVKGAEWSEVKERLANVACAKWRKRGDDWIFERPSALVRKQHEQVLRQRVDALRTQIDKLAKRMPTWSELVLNQAITSIARAAEAQHGASPRYASEATESLIQTGLEAPAGRALIRILQKMEPRDLAELEPDGMTAYSDPPTRVERKLPGDTAAILKDFNQEEAAFAKRVEERKDLFAPVEFLDPRFNISSNDPQATRMLLTLRRFGPGAIDIALSLADKEGWVLSRASVSLTDSLEELPQAAADPDEQVQLSPAGIEYQRIFQVVSGLYGGDLGNVDEAWVLARKWVPTFEKADQVEPLQFVVGDLLRKSADASRRNVVACLPDDLMAYVPGLSPDNRISTTRFLSSLNSQFRNSVVRQEPGWIVLQPLDSLAAAADRVDRKALAKLMRDLAVARKTTLDDVGSYALKVTGHQCFRCLDCVFPKILSQGRTDPGQDLASPYFVDVARIWGALSGSQRAALRNGGSFLAGELSPDGKRWLAHYVYGINRVGATNFESPFDSKDFLARRNIRSSPYEGLGSGIPDSTRIGADIGDEFILRLLRQGQALAEHCHPETFARWFGGEGWPLAGPGTPVRSISQASVSTITIHFDFGNGYRGWTKVSDQATDWSTGTSFADLPDKLRNQIQGEYDAALARKTDEERKIGQRTIPPR